MTILLLLLAASVGVLVYVYAGYPVLLHLLVWLRGPRPVRRANITPTMSLVISAYNEARVIRGKLQNALSLTYPRELLDIVVVSDASTDETDAIVAEYAGRVRLARQQERRGKTAGLNHTVPGLAGDIVVFSDANAMYAPDALMKLAANFADAEVGCVTGEARYLADRTSAADFGERAYWDYEINIKRLETAVGSMVGGDGAIYAIRRPLWRELPENAINDFLNPLQIVEAGWRAVYEPLAVCYEETAGGVRSEYRRRVRIISRSWRAVFEASGVLNPRRVGLFTWSLVSHKILRWLSGFVAMIAAASAIGVFGLAFERQPIAVATALLAPVIGLGVTRVGRRLLATLGYFMVINVASMVGVLKGCTGRVSGVWSTPRHTTRPVTSPGHTTRPVTSPGPLLEVGTVVELIAAISIVGAIVAYRTLPGEQFATILFWSSVAMLGYVYFAYPALLSVVCRFADRPVTRAAIEPNVCVFIAANDEEAVIAAKLENTLALDYPQDRLDIVVASDGSVDDTNRIVRRFAPRVRLLELDPRRGKIGTINEGIKSVTAEVVVFSDANTFLDANAIRALVRNFADDEVGGVSGDVALIGERARLARSEDLYYSYERWIQRAESAIGSMIGADGALYAIRRELFVAPAHDTILDDMAIPMAVVRAGRRVVFEEEAHAVEQGSATAKEEFSRKTRVIAGAMQFVRRRDSGVPVSALQVVVSLVSHKVLRWLSPLFATMAFVTSLVLAPVWPGYAAAAAAQVLLVALGVAGCAPSLRRVAVVALAHYCCLVQAAAAVGFIRGLSGRQSVLWRRFIRVPLNQPVA